MTLIERLKNCNTSLIDLSRATDDEILKEHITDIRQTVLAAISELEFVKDEESEGYAESVVAETMLKIKALREQIEGADTERQPPHTLLPKP
jgi:hypothetical protein